MHRWSLVLGVCLLTGCQAGEPPLPPVAPMVDDLSMWTVPELVQPERHTPRPSSQRAAKVPAGAAEKVYDYAPGVAVEVPVALGHPLDIVLEAGEQVRQIVDGDRVPVEQGQTRRWQVHEGGDGTGDGLRPHVFVTVSEAGVTNGVTITTTRRVYYITCKSVAKSPTRVLRWHYPPESQTTALVKDAPGLLPHPEQPMRYHVGYDVASSQKHAPDWMPRHAIDDGKKMFIVLPEVTLFGTAPMVRMIGPNGAALINVRQFLNVLILDQLAARLELRIGIGEHAEVVTITRGNLKTITCPEDADCPRWPDAARVLARREQR